MTLSTNIRAARASKKLTQKQLATKAGVSLVYIKKLESGELEPKFKLMDVARVLGVSVERLLTNIK